MSKNHPHDNIYSILGKLEALTPKEQTVVEAPETVYESVDSQGSILKGLREVSTIETRLAEAFAKDKDDGHCKECDCDPCECAKEELEESKCNECGMFESKCSCDHTNEGEVTHPSKGVTRHTKTDFPGYPSDDTLDTLDGVRGPGTVKRGRPLKAQTKNPRRDPNVPKLGRGRPKKDVAPTYTSMNDPFGRVPSKAPKSKVKGTVHSMAEAMDLLSQQLGQLNEGRHIVDESGETLEHILNRFKHDVKRFEAGEDIYGTDLYHALFDYYCDNGEMPYGTQKARDGDPVNWISDRLNAKLGLDEAIDPANPRDYEIPAFLRKQQGQAPLTARDIMQKDKKPEHDFYQRRTGETHPDALKTELDELAQLAGLSEVSRGEYIKQQDTAAEKSGKGEFNAFGQLFKTDEVTEDPEAEFEGNEFSGELSKAKAQHKDSFEVDGKEYPVQEDKIEVDGDDEENANKPKPKYGTIKAITTQGDDLNRQKKQDPRTANRAANPLTNVTTLESELAAEYESIKKLTK